MTGMIGMNKNTYVNHFNQQSEQYSLCRPDYPDALFDYLATQVEADATVWDCGTGSGQAAKSLAMRFKKVIATDLNAGQLAAATPMKNIEYQSKNQKNPLELIIKRLAFAWGNANQERVIYWPLHCLKSTII